MSSVQEKQVDSPARPARSRRRSSPGKKKISGKADVVALLNPELTVTLRGIPRKATAEEISIRRVLRRAIKGKELKAIRHLLKIFDDYELLTSADRERGSQIIVPKYFEIDDYMNSLKGIKTYKEWLKQMPPVNILGRLEREKQVARRRQTILENLKPYDDLLRERRAERHLIYEARSSSARLIRTLDYIDGVFEDYSSIFKAESDCYDRWLDEDEANWEMHKAKVQFLKHFEFTIVGPILKKKSDVGYCKPPVHTRFKKGQSGNPAGRPSAKMSRKKLVQKIANEPQKVMNAGKLVERTNIELVLISLANLAMEGDVNADMLRREYLVKYDSRAGEPRAMLIVPEQVSVDEYMLLLDEFRWKSAEEFAKIRERDETRFLEEPRMQHSQVQAPS